jgi:hypothetical protein
VPSAASEPGNVTGDWTGRAPRMLAGTPELAGYSFAMDLAFFVAFVPTGQSHLLAGDAVRASSRSSDLMVSVKVPIGLRSAVAAVRLP